MVHRRQRPQNRNGAVGEGELLGRALEVVRARAAAAERAEGAGDAQHHGGGVDADDGRSSAGRGPADGDARSAADVEDIVVRPDVGQPDGKVSGRATTDAERQRGDEAAEPGERGIVGVVVGRQFGVAEGS